MEAVSTCDAPAVSQGSDLRQLQFSEANGAWQAIPAWADFLVRLGYCWPAGDPTKRRISLISMPCDSGAAGLVALGAMRRRLERDGADDLASHFQRIRDLARNQGSRITLFDLRKRGRERGPYLVDELFSSEMVWVRLESAPATRMSISLADATHWQFDREPPVQVLSGNRVAYGAHYAELVEQAGCVETTNLSRSDSLICLAGRAIGEADTRDAFANIRFRANGCIADLSELLTVQKWSPRTISRISFFNARTGEIDRNTRNPQIVVADGDRSLLKVLEREEFMSADVIGVAHRILERDKLEELGSRLANLEQWYDRDREMLDALPSLPRGIALTILKRR